ncbi:MAG: hypothetical protein JOY64_14415 [Alphaproteobacteria bacterium]|nr:hypothetical protein [Alphaproteobacteria bacterium]
MRLLGSAALVALVFFGAGNLAAQDGLQRFEKEIKPQMELKSFTYKNAAAKGDSGFVLNDVVAVVPGNPKTGDKATTIKIEKVTVDALDFDRLNSKDDELPRFAKLKAEGISGDDDVFNQLAPYGVPKVPVDFALDYKLDAAKKVLTLSALELSLRGQGSLVLALVVDDVSTKQSEMDGAKDKARLRTASLDLADSGLIAKVLEATAKSQGSTPEALVATATTPIGAFAAGQGPATVKALDGIVSFMLDWKKPQGPIKISVTPTKSASLQDLDKIGQPNALVDYFGLAVDYPGTRPVVTSLAAPQSAAAPPASGSGGATELTGVEAAASIAGNTLYGKLDGDAVYEYYGKDGKTGLLEGSDISTGKWTIEGEKLCTKYKGDDKDCYSVRRKGDEVTMIGAKGKGYRLKLLPGNPKDL